MGVFQLVQSRSRVFGRSKTCLQRTFAKEAPSLRPPHILDQGTSEASRHANNIHTNHPL